MSENEPAVPFISSDLRVRGGAPCLHGTRLLAELIASQYWWLGEYLQFEILDAYSITRADVLICCWYQAQHGSRTWRTRWGGWLNQTWSDSDWNLKTVWYAPGWTDVPLPPTRAQTKEQGT